MVFIKVICIYILNNSSLKLTEKLLATPPNKIKVPSIVKAELLYGAAKSKRKKENRAIVDKFLSAMEIVPFEEVSAEYYAEIRAKLETSGKIIGPNDLLIASIVLANNGTLVTNNLKEFSRVPKLKVVNWK